MSEHRSEPAPAVRSSSKRSGPWIMAAIGAISLSGLVVGGLLVPVSANDVAGSVGSGVSAEFAGGCATIAAAGGGAEGSVSPQGDGSSSGLAVSADGDGASEVSVCLDELGDDLPADPGGAIPGDPGDIVPDGLDVVGEVAAAIEGELDGAVPGDPGDGVPGDGDWGDALPEVGDGLPGDGLPGDGLPGGGVPGGGVPGGGVPGNPGDTPPGEVGDIVPGDGGGLLPDGLGLVPDLVDRLLPLVLGEVDEGGPGGSDGDGPPASPAANGSGTAPIVADPGDGDEDAPAEPVSGGGLGDDASMGSTDGTALPTGGTLPRTGGGPGVGLLRIMAFLGIGRAVLRLAGRSRTSWAALGRTN